jgi:hypothetical protein
VSKAIFEVVDRLPKNNVTTMMLNALDFVVPGQWQNLVGFDNTIKTVTGETDEQLIQQIGERAVYLFNDKSQGYQNALWLYQTVDSADSALGAAALANKVGEKISFLGFLDRITPNPDKAQSIDLQLKLVAELLAFCQINGIPGDSIGDFAASLGDYSGESLMRMAALVCVDGLIPLGPDFIQKVQDNFNNTSDGDLKGNPIFSRISKLIPGGSTGEQLGFIGNAFSSVSGWMNDFVSSRGLTPQMVFGNLRNFIDISDDKLDYVGAFLDLSTNYYEHTGTQTLARRLIERAVAEI